MEFPLRQRTLQPFNRCEIARRLSHAPVSKDAMAGSGRGVVAGNDDQFAATEVCEGDLDGALGKAGRVGKHS
jgi:hypothetical protein